MTTHSDDSMPTYTATSPPRPSADELRARVPGWGVDLDPADRPSYPKLVDTRGLTGAHWEFPPRQPGGEDRERSVEHAFVTPVFGTAQPLHGLSGAIRRLAYRRFSEARTAHWLLLVAADRVEVAGAVLRSLVSRRPDDPVTETGIAAELGSHPVASRFGEGRSDWKHQWLDPVVVAGPWVLGAVALRSVVRRLRR
jgi:hypothetical protein